MKNTNNLFELLKVIDPSVVKNPVVILPTNVAVKKPNTIIANSLIFTINGTRPGYGNLPAADLINKKSPNNIKLPNTYNVSLCMLTVLTTAAAKRPTITTSILPHN